MALTEKEVEVEAELQALRYLLAHAFSLIYGAKRSSESDIQKFHAEIRAQVAQQTFPQYGPAMSDHYSDVLQREIDRIFRTIEVLGPASL